MLPPPPRSTLFPYTTLFRSLEGVTEGVNDRLALSLAHEPVVHVHARELLADRPMDQDRGHGRVRSEEHTSELQSPYDLVCRLLLEKKKKKNKKYTTYKKLQS